MTMLEDIRSALAQADAGDHPDQIEAEYRFDEGCAFFAGHFPGHPLLPGVFQIGMVLEAAAAMGVRYDLVRVARAKFADEIAPGQPVTVRATFSGPDTEREVRATLHNQRGLAGKLTLVVRPRET